MSVLAELSIFPVGVGVSLSPYVARCVEEVRDSGLAFELHAMGTDIEADNFQQIAEVVGRCIGRLSEDCERVSVTLKLDVRRGRAGGLAEKVASVQRKLG